MQTYFKTRPIWVQLLLFLAIAFSVFVILLTISAFILSSITGINPMVMQNINNWNPNDSKLIFYLRGLYIVQFISLWIIPSFIFAFISDPHPMYYLGLKPPSRNIFWGLAIIALLVSFPFVEYMGYLNQHMHFGPSIQQWLKTKQDENARQIQFMLARHTPKELIMNLIFIALFAGVGEELFFRGVLQRMFIRILRNPWGGIVITALIFSAFHMEFLGFIPRFLLGVLLGAIYWYSGSLIVAMFIHFFYDGSMIVLAYYNPSVIQSDVTVFNPLQLLIWAIIGLGLTIFVIKIMKKLSSTSYVEIYKNDIRQVDKFTF